MATNRARLWQILGAALATVICLVMFVLPVITVIISSLAKQWSGTILPAALTLRWFERIGGGDLNALVISLQVAATVAAAGTVLGAWLALTLETRINHRGGLLLDLLVMVPNGIPSVVVGLAILIAYHDIPPGFAGSGWIVITAQLALVLPFCYRSAASALRPELKILREAAQSLGATRSLVIRRVVLPQMAPALRASLAIAFALSIGELGATITVYPPGFATAPVVILGEVERGYYLPASALSVMLLAAALIVLLAVAVPWGKVFARGHAIQTAK